MKIAILSDIHSNLEALLSVLEDIDTNKINKIYCLGDVVGYGPDPKECCKELIERDIPTILGNHDEAVSFMLLRFQFNTQARVSIEHNENQLGANERN